MPWAYRSEQVAQFLPQAHEGSPFRFDLISDAAQTYSSAPTRASTMMFPIFASNQVIPKLLSCDYLILTSCVSVSDSLYGLNSMYTTKAMIAIAQIRPKILALPLIAEPIW